MDHAVSALVEDVLQRGMSDNILLVISGEFGRTPKVNKNMGRDHWAPLTTLALAGGGLKMGQTVGESARKVDVPKTTPIRPQDLMATIFHVLGIDRRIQYIDPAGRPIGDVMVLAQITYSKHIRVFRIRDGGRFSTKAAKTDETGRFEIRGYPEGQSPCKVTFRREGFVVVTLVPPARAIP